MIAFLADKHDTVGIDAVAMCVNDVLVQGAEPPLFFLDYIACGKNDPARTEKLVAGVAEGCVRAGCACSGGVKRRKCRGGCTGQMNMIWPVLR